MRTCHVDFSAIAKTSCYPSDLPPTQHFAALGGMEPERVTQNAAAHEQLLYFTSSSLTGDDRHLVFISDRTGHPNLVRRNLETGEERMLSDNTDGYLKSYVYYTGRPYEGFGKASVSLHAASGTVYYLQGREIRQVDPEGATRVLGLYPEEQMTGFTHVSADGRWLCVPTVDARALNGDQPLEAKPHFSVGDRVRDEGLFSYLRIYDTETGKEEACEPVRGGWGTHVQFSPADARLLLYNHENLKHDAGVRRMWLWDGKTHRALRTAENGRRAEDWACHEMWERDGSAIIYHGGFHNGATFIGRVLPDGNEPVEIALPANYKRYGHFTTGRPGVLVSDGYYEEADDRDTWGGQWISRVEADWQHATSRWKPLCRSESSWTSQDVHPHPIIAHRNQWVYFTSDRDGKRAVWRVALDS